MFVCSLARYVFFSRLLSAIQEYNIVSRYYLLFIFVALIILSCSSRRYLSNDEILYTGAKIQFAEGVEIEDERDIKAELEAVLRPSPNVKLLGLIRHRLWFHYIGGGNAENGWRGWIGRKLGEPAVLLRDADPENTSRLMINRLENNGYFRAQVEYDVRHKKKSADILYTVNPGLLYRIANIVYPEPDTELKKEIKGTEETSVLRKQKQFTLSLLRKERDRISVELKNRGFYYFNAEYISFLADSTSGDNTVNIYVTVRDDIPPKAINKYRIGRIYILQNFALRNDAERTNVDTVVADSHYFVGDPNKYKPAVFSRLVFLQHNDYYNRKNHLLTINRLMRLETFRFVNIRFEPDTDAPEETLYTHISLRSANKHSIRAEFQAISKSNDLAGPGFNIGYRNRNLLRGGEVLTVDTHSSFETLITDQRRWRLDQYHIGIESELQIPRIISPVPLPTRETMYLPRTRIRLGYEGLDRMDELRLDSFSTRFGYMWMSTRFLRHELDPIIINFVRSSIRNPGSGSDIPVDPVTLQSLESQFIIGANYSLVYNNQIDQQRRNHMFFRLQLDLSGNTLHLVQSLFGQKEPTPDSPYTLLGIPYSQYTRAEIDFRYFWRPSTGGRIATRLVFGAGIPYGNSAYLPYVKQFFIGGSSSIRAFAARSLGPGTLYPPEPGAGRLDRTGDMRIETNIEYRFPVLGMINGAFFTDAGNIWMVNDDREREGTEFNVSTFYREVAIGSGFGLRIDASFFVLRFDLAFPLRKPFLPPGERWVIGDIDFGSSRWRNDNLTYIIAIGHPF